jgi:tetratricopeptide (TPR) repeat protein
MFRIENSLCQKVNHLELRLNSLSFEKRPRKPKPPSSTPTALIAKQSGLSTGVDVDGLSTGVDVDGLSTGVDVDGLSTGVDVDGLSTGVDVPLMLHTSSKISKQSSSGVDVDELKEVKSKLAELETQMIVLPVLQSKVDKLDTLDQKLDFDATKTGRLESKIHLLEQNTKPFFGLDIDSIPTLTRDAIKNEMDLIGWGQMKLEMNDLIKWGSKIGLGRHIGNSRTGRDLNDREAEPSSFAFDGQTTPSDEFLQISGVLERNKIKVDVLHSNVQDAVFELGSVKSKIDVLENKVGGFEGVEVVIRSNLDDVMTEVGQIKSKMKYDGVTVSNLQQHVNQKFARVDQLVEDVESVKLDLGVSLRLKSTLSELRADYESDFASVEKTLQKLNEIDLLKSDMNALKTLSTQLDQLKLDMKKLSEIDLLKAELRKLGEIDKIKSDMSKLSEIDQLKSDISKLNKMHNQLKLDMKKLSEIDLLKAELRKLGEIDKIKTELVKLTKSDTKHLDEINRLNNDMSQLGKIDQLKADMRKLNEIDQLKADMRKLNEIDMTELLKKISVLELETTDLRELDTKDLLTMQQKMLQLDRIEHDVKGVKKDQMFSITSHSTIHRGRVSFFSPGLIFPHSILVHSVCAIFAPLKPHRLEGDLPSSSSTRVKNDETQPSDNLVRANVNSNSSLRSIDAGNTGLSSQSGAGHKAANTVSNITSFSCLSNLVINNTLTSESSPRTEKCKFQLVTVENNGQEIVIHEFEAHKGTNSIVKECKPPLKIEKNKHFLLRCDRKVEANVVITASHQHD